MSRRRKPSKYNRMAFIKIESPRMKKIFFYFLVSKCWYVHRGFKDFLWYIFQYQSFHQGLSLLISNLRLEIQKVNHCRGWIFSYFKKLKIFVRVSFGTNGHILVGAKQKCRFSFLKLGFLKGTLRWIYNMYNFEQFGRINY